MGFLTSIGKMFGGSAPEQRRNAATGPSESDGNAAAVATIDQATALRERIARETAPPRQRRRAPGDSAVRSEAASPVEAEAKPAASQEPAHEMAPTPRTKQELFEDLQRNYRDVVDLVRKVDAHLDRNEQRAQEMATIARRIDETLPALQSFPEQVREQLDRLNTEVVTAIRETSSRSDARAGEIQKTLTTIGGRIESTSESHAQLVTTMAGFRQTLGDLATSSDRTSSTLESIDSRRQEREDELTKMLIASRRWSVTTLAVTLLGVSVAAAIAIVALVINA